jgi:hypothetical protein
MIRLCAVSGIVILAVGVAGCSHSTAHSPPAHAKPTAVGQGVPKPRDSEALRKMDRAIATSDAGRAPRSGGQTPRQWFPGNVGTYQVGRGIPPGKYRSARSPVGRCVWARLNSSSPSARSVVASGSTAGPVTVTIKANDKFFETSGCASWHRLA